MKGNSNDTTETRNLWMVPLLGLLHYNIECQTCGTVLNGQTYAIKHRATNRADTSIHIVGCCDPAGSGQEAGQRQAPHVSPRAGTGVPEPR